MVVALRPETGASSGSEYLQIFQSLGDDHQKNVIRWALANRARVTEEASGALNDALIASVEIRGFQNTGVPDAPAIMLIQPVREAANDNSELAQAVLTVWELSRPELRAIVKEGLVEVNHDASDDQAAAGLAESLANGNPQYSLDDVRLMIALSTDGEIAAVDDDHAEAAVEDVTADEPLDVGVTAVSEGVESDAATGSLFDDFLAELVVLPADSPEWDGPLDQLMADIAELKAKKARDYEEAHGVGSRLREVLQTYADLLVFFEWDPDERQPNAAGPWGDADAVLTAIDDVADLLARYESLREMGATYSEEAGRVAERADLHPQILEALTALEDATIIPAPEPAIEEVVPDEIEPANTVDSTVDAAPIDSVDAMELQYLRSMLTVLQQQNAELTSAVERARTLVDESEEVIGDDSSHPDNEQDDIEDEPSVDALTDDVDIAGSEAEDEPNDDDPQPERDLAVEPSAGLPMNDDDLPETVEAEDISEAENSLTEAAEVEILDVDEELATPPDFGDVASVLDFAEDRWPSGLRLALNHSSDRNLYFDQPNQVYEALEWLATTYRDARTGEKPVTNLDVSLFTTCGWRYRPSQMDITAGAYRPDFQTIDDGKTYLLEEHIGRGTGRTPGQMRVAFSWDDERKIVVVGYIGRLQRTDTT